MTDVKSPIFVVDTGEKTTDSAGLKPAYHHFHLEWGTDPGPGGTHRKALIHVTRYPGSTDTLFTVLRVYDDAGEVIERNERDKGEVRLIADKFEKAGADIEHGTPIAVLNLDPAKLAGLKDKGIVTVEALRDVPEVQLPTMGHGARAMRDRAAEFLAHVDRNQVVNQLHGENEGLRETQKALQEEMETMRREMAALRQQQGAAGASGRQSTAKGG